MILKMWKEVMNVPIGDGKRPPSESGSGTGRGAGMGGSRSGK